MVPFELIISCTGGYLGAEFLSLLPVCGQHPCFTVSCGLCWNSCSASKPHILTRVHLVVAVLNGLNLSSHADQSKIVISRGGDFFPYQNSDLVLKAIKISEPSSQGESLSHGIEHNVQKVLWFPVLLRAWDICQNKTIRCILFMCWSTDSAPACQPSTHLQNCKIILWRIARTLWTLAAALQPNVSKFFYQWPIPKWECSVDRKALPLPF